MEKGGDLISGFGVSESSNFIGGRGDSGEGKVARIDLEAMLCWNCFAQLSRDSEGGFE